MRGKIAFEEHMAIEQTVEETKDFAGESGRFDDFTQELLDMDTKRLDFMDSNGIELALLSLNAPGVQSILDREVAVDVAQQGNDTMAAAYFSSSWPLCWACSFTNAGPCSSYRTKALC